jgi:uncharacterized protein (TIGR02680 family)
MTSTVPRFRPSRAGIVGLWDYTDATFAFASGRLVLRGANGSGKTKALEVLFPFVLDGRLDPRRLDPFSGENRTMKDNLLWRGTDTGHGYVWLEFVLPGPTTRHVTVGAGLQAQRHRPVPRSWFFVVEGRVGDQVVLVDADGRPRTRRALIDDLGDGVVVDRASEHRRRVDEALFGLGGERYEAMLDLVLTLRRPMLAKDLDPRLLSETLTRGLRPLDDDLIEQVARSFDDLEAVQRDLDRLVHAEEAARAFVTDYRGYLRTQARHRADATLDAEAARDAARRRRDEAVRALDEARAAEAMAEAEAAATDASLAADGARRDALRASEAFRTAGQLDHLERSVRDLAAERHRAETRAEQAARDAQRADEQRHRAARDRARADAEVARLAPRVLAAAVDAGVAWSDTDAASDAPTVRQRVAGRTAARRADLDEVRARLAELDDAERRVAVADEAADRAEEADDVAALALATAEQTVAAARATLRDELGGWAFDHPDVAEPGDLDALAAAVDAVGTDGDGLVARWRARLEPRLDDAAGTRAGLSSRAATLADQAAALAQRRQAIREERDDAPPPAPWRGPGREHRAGAPLWRLVRFADGLPPPVAAGIEAALEASGLLDAWVRPDGSVDHTAGDAFLVAEHLPGPAPHAADEPTGAAGEPLGAHRTLADVLEVEDAQTDLPPGTVRRVLRAVALDHPVLEAFARDDAFATGHLAAVASDGRYRLGPLAGAHRVDAPRYIGATARAAHRAARVAALDEELATLERERSQLADELATVDAWVAAARAATDALPPSGGLVAALREEDRAAGRRQAARDALTAAHAAAEAARREVNDRRAAFGRTARARALPPSREGIAAVTTALERFTGDGAELVAAVHDAAVRAGTARQADERAAAAAAAAEAGRQDAAERRRQHDARAVEYATLEQRMGADAQAVMAELRDVEAALTAGEAARRSASVRSRTAAAARGQAEGEVAAATEALAGTDDRVAAAHRRLEVLARPDLADPLGLIVPDDDAEVALLDAVDALVAGVSGADERRKAARTRIQRSLEDLDHALGAGYRPTWDVEDDIIVVTVTDDIGDRSVARFAAELATQRAEQEALLTARERALFEDALLTSVCGQIHDRTQTTRELVATMDEQMRARRLSSGQTVGVAWRVDDTATPEWKQVHRLLDQDPAHFGPDQLDALRAHFSAEIKAVRAADPGAPYRDLLARVLDYRQWRRFELSLVEADGSHALLTRARHARLSGGEKAASLHLPLFAAAHAAFAAARPSCPRLLALDEAFAGIDDLGRSELLSLTVAFDLDLFMTGFDLWAVDRRVPAVAHYDLLHLPDEHAVSTLLVLWNGHELVEGPDAELALAELASTGPGA